MPRTVNLTFSDGSRHLYQDVPIDASAEQVIERARKDFPRLTLTRVERLGEIPTAPTAAQAAQGAVQYQAPPATAPIVDGSKAGLMDRIVGAGEAALTTATGMTGGMVGMVGGATGATAAAILDGSFGTKEAADMIERAASEGAQTMTYQPRTASGQSQAETIGQGMQQLVPLMGLTPQMGMMAAGLRPLTQAMTVGARAGVAGVEDAAAAMAGRRNAAQAAAQAEKPAAQAATATEIVQTAKAAGQGSNRAAEVLATQVAPDPRIVKSAERLGVQDYLQPDHVTTSEAYRQVTGAIKSNPQSAVALAERDGLAAVAKRASDLVDEIGGSNDLSTLDATLKGRMQETHASLLAKEDGLYEQMRAEIDPRSPAPAPAVLAFIEKRAADLGGIENLAPVERMVLGKLKARGMPTADEAAASPVVPVETLQQFVKRNPMPRDVTDPAVKPAFFSWLRSVGGIDMRHKFDISSERSGVLSNPAGIFRKGGRAPDQLALLAEEEGYLPPGGGTETRAFVDLVQQAIRGDQPLTMERQGAYMARDAQLSSRAERLAAVEKRLQTLGVDTSAAKGNPAVLEAYERKHASGLISSRGAASEALPAEWEQLRGRARQIASDIVDGERTLPQYEAEVRPLSPVMRKMVSAELGLSYRQPDSPMATRQPTYALLDDVRKDVGAASRQRGAFADTDTGLAKKLYSLLLDDQEQAVSAAGLKPVFDEARGLTVLRKGMEDDLSALFGKNLDRTFVAGGDLGLPGAVRGLASGDAARLTRLLSAVPEDLRQQVVASGISTVFRKAATRGEMDFTSYAKWWNGLQRNRQAYSAIMSNLPMDARKQLTALARVSQGISDSLATRVKTGALNTIKQEMMSADGVMESLYGLAKRASVSIPAEAMSSAMGLPGAGIAAGLSSALTKGKPKAMAAVDSLIASPEYLQLVKSRAGTPQQAAAIKKIARGKEFTRLLKAVNLEMSLSERELFIVQSMQVGAASNVNERRRSAMPAPSTTTLQ